jgi:hypothetical protein
MILSNHKDLDDNFFSVIIIGSGPAGISTALKLEEYKIKTLIVESGNLNEDFSKDKFLKGNLYGDFHPDEDISTKRDRTFGGTSSLWAGYCSKFEREHFKNWPITYEEAYKYEDKCNEILGLKSSSPEFYYKSFNESFNQFNRKFATQRRFKIDYYEKIKNSKYIYLSLNTSFLKFKGSSNKIKTITCKIKDDLIDLKSNFFVLAAGGIENSRLLLWSKENDALLFNKDLPIGNYYMDHPWHHPAEGFVNYRSLINYFEKNKVSREFYLDCLPRLNLAPNKKFKKDNELLSVALWLRFENENDTNRNFFNKVFCIAPNFFKKKFEKNKSERLLKFNLSLHHEQEPLFENKVYLSEKVDPYGIPLINLNWKMSNKLKNTAKKSLVEFGKFLINHDIGRISIDDYIFHKKYKAIFSGNHQMGGTRMGRDSKSSVVDKNLKVHSIQNLFITGSSVFPTSGHGHPTFTIICLSLKLGEHLKNSL